MLLAGANEGRVPIYIVLTMRSDFLGRCAEFEGLAEAITDAQYLCPRLSREQIAAAVEGPAKVFKGEVEPRLVARIVNDMGHGHSLTSAVFSPDGARVVAASVDETARLWDAATGASLAVLRGHARSDGAWVVTASVDSTARLWDAATGASLAVLHSAAVGRPNRRVACRAAGAHGPRQ